MNVIFVKCVADDTYLTPKAKYDSLTHDAGTFYLVGSELYLGDVLLSANMAEEVGIEDAGSVFTATDVEGALSELHSAAVDKTIWIHDDSAGQSEYAKVYNFYQGENDYVADRTDGKTNPVLKGTINIPKDKFVKDGSVVEITFDETEGKLYDGLVDVTELIVGPSGTATAADAGKYIKIELQNVDDPLYVKATDLVDIYTGGTTDETTVNISNANEITVDINKIAATKSIYQAEAYNVVPGTATYDATVDYYTKSGDVYTKDTTVDASNFADKVAAGLYTKDEEINVKDKIDIVDGKVDALADYVGEIPSGSSADTVIEYVDEKTGEGVGSLNAEAGIASVASNVVTIKGGIVETEGLIANSVATAPATEVNGFLKPADGKFYEESTYDTEITPASNTAYIDGNGTGTYVWTGKKYALVRADIVLEEVAVTGAAADVSVADAGSHFAANSTVESALQEIGDQLTWNEV